FQGNLWFHPSCVPTSPPCRHQEDAPKQPASESTPSRGCTGAATRRMATPRRADRLRIRNHAESPVRLTPSCARLRPASTALPARPPAVQPGPERWPLPVHSDQRRLRTLYGSSWITLKGPP